jgi:hypothetical protein
MVRAALVTAGALLLTGATQVPDERAAARAFVDAFALYAAVADELPQRVEGPARMRPCIERVHRRVAEHRWDELLAFSSIEEHDRPSARRLHPLLMRLSVELHAVETADPALRGGRTTVRRARRAFAAILALPRTKICAAVRRWVRNEFEPTPALLRIRRATGTRQRVAEGEDTERRVAAMVARMRELGIPAEELEWFDS